MDNKLPSPNLKSQQREIAPDYSRAALEIAEKLRDVVPTPEAAHQVADEKDAIELEGLRLQNKRLANKLAEAEGVHNLRRTYTSRLFWLTVCWLVAVVAFIALAGFQVRGFLLSDKVIIAFITSTTINVIGLFLIPARWLFPHSKDE